MTTLFAKRIEVDEEGKATNIKLHSIARPHMRSFHLSWLSFMVAFTGWFSVPPLLETLTPALKLTDPEIGNANLTSVSATILARVAVGPLCDRYGPKRVMALLLVLGAIATGLVGFVSNGVGLITVRFFIGILGATFVPCQFWTTKMFNPKVVGTANALVGGWGNMGGGLTYLVMPSLFAGFAAVLPVNIAWRVTFVVPALICILVGILDYTIADDCPHGDWLKVRKADLEKVKQPTVNEKVNLDVVMKTEQTQKLETKEATPAEESSQTSEYTEAKEPEMSVVEAYIHVLKNPTTWIIMLQYACTFGLELAVDNIIGKFFTTRFKVDQLTSGRLASIFGLMNLFSRASGGFLGDWLNHIIGQGVMGRLLAQQLITFFEGVTLIAFSYATGTLASAVTMMVVFSYFVQAGCGTTFSIAPFVNRKHYGLLTGLVGAGGNIGGVAFNYIFKAYGSNYEGAFRIIGIAVLCVSLLSLVSKVEDKLLWKLFIRSRR